MEGSGQLGSANGGLMGTKALSPVQVFVVHHETLKYVLMLGVGVCLFECTTDLITSIIQASLASVLLP